MIKGANLIVKESQAKFDLMSYCGTSNRRVLDIHFDFKIEIKRIAKFNTKLNDFL